MSDREPICTHRDHAVGRVSSHPDLVAANRRGEATASTLVCADDMCQSDAANWVHGEVGVLGTFYPLGGGEFR